MIYEIERHSHWVKMEHRNDYLRKYFMSKWLKKNKQYYIFFISFYKYSVTNNVKKPIFIQKRKKKYKRIFIEILILNFILNPSLLKTNGHFGLLKKFNIENLIWPVYNRSSYLFRFIIFGNTYKICSKSIVFYLWKIRLAHKWLSRIFMLLWI